jgi:hypothetical protein
MEGKGYLKFENNKITKTVAVKNYKYWAAKESIPKILPKDKKSILNDIKNVFGAHTMPARIISDKKIIYPILSAFGYDKTRNKFSEDENCGLQSDHRRKGDGKHLSTARELGLNKYVFSYLGVHTPYHRIGDDPPVLPFGMFLKVEDFAYLHGSPCDRDYKKNGLVDQTNIDKYFLLPNDLQKIIANRIVEDPYFNKDFWKYYGSPENWDKDENYAEEHWKKKGEYCFFDMVKPSSIAAILWPVWEETISEDGQQQYPNELFDPDLMNEFKQTYNINIIIYRPYRDVVNSENWNTINLRDWEMGLIEASYIAKKFYMKNNFFPDSIAEAQYYLNN